MKVILVLLFLLTQFIQTTNCQVIRNVDFVVDADNKLVVTYNLISSEMNCDIRMLVIVEGTPLHPISITGDLYSVSAGFGKMIIWDVLKDRTVLEGNIQIKLEIVRSYSSIKKITRIKGGPSNALLSLIMPGLGDQFVNPQDKDWYLLSLGFLASGACAYGFKKESDKYYNQYQYTTNQIEKDKAYKSAKEYNDLFTSMVVTAGLIYVCDFFYVLSKGSRNRREQKSSQSSNFSPVNLYFNNNNQYKELGIILHF